MFHANCKSPNATGRDWWWTEQDVLYCCIPKWKEEKGEEDITCVLFDKATTALLLRCTVVGLVWVSWKSQNAQLGRLVGLGGMLNGAAQGGAQSSRKWAGQVQWCDALTDPPTTACPRQLVTCESIRPP